MLHLIADSGIQFHTTDAVFNPSEQLALPGGRPLKYSFCNIVNELTGVRLFDLLAYHAESGRYIPVTELVDKRSVELQADGRPKLDDMGVEVIRRDIATSLFTQLNPESHDNFYTFNNLLSYKVPRMPANGERVPGFELLLGHWLPMPMFEMQQGITGNVPYAWCRVKIDRVGQEDASGNARYRFTWAFDTRTSDNPMAEFRPSMPDNGADKVAFALCNRVSTLINFMSPIGDFTVFSHYVAQLLGLDPKGSGYRYIGFYIYLINYLRMLGVAPEVTLHRCPKDREIPVDMVLDIGNSRTCGILFENSDFTKAAMLTLRDLTDPSVPYDHPFDMRLVFRQADFANDIVIEDEPELFRYLSLVRVGDEARRLVYKSVQNEGMWTSNTNYSSPKRYLWDNRPFDEAWRFLTTDDDPLYIRQAESIYMPVISDLFDANGELVRNPFDMAESTDGRTHYSRSSLMTFVLIEILQQALMQINSPEFRTAHGAVNCRRYLRSLILTCPTAMPLTEQIKLRQCAADAYEALCNVYNNGELAQIQVYPSVDKLTAGKNDAIDGEKGTWTFDEATCSQLVYLYAEIAKRYTGLTRKFFDLKGHVRPELAEEGYTDKALTVASVDIGAGTTDVMVCTYKCTGTDGATLVPRPIFWDSFYVAGDDILRNIIQNVIIEDRGDDYPDMGSVYAALSARFGTMTVDEIAAIPSMSKDRYYAIEISNLRSASTPEEVHRIKEKLASSLLRDFFGVDSNMMDFTDRSCRVDFNTQISHPMAQFFMEQLRLRRPFRVYTFDEIFSDMRPSEYLLDYFADHFGFRFEELKWRFDPRRVGDIVKSTMEKLMKQISVMLYAHQCDIVILSGRPTSLDAVTELFVKYLPVTPDRLVRLNDYRVGQWFPLANPQGYFIDQKAVVAVGAMIGHIASTTGYDGMVVDFSEMAKYFHSTAYYIGIYKGDKYEQTIMTPHSNSRNLNLTVFPCFFGCRQFDTPHYDGRPLYALYNDSGRSMLNVTISRDFAEDPERLVVEDVTDANGDPVPLDSITFMSQSIINDGSHWLDKGVFELGLSPR